MALPRFWRLPPSPLKLLDKPENVDEPLAKPPAQLPGALRPDPQILSISTTARRAMSTGRVMVSLEMAGESMCLL